VVKLLVIFIKLGEVVLEQAKDVLTASASFAARVSAVGMINDFLLSG